MENNTNPKSGQPTQEYDVSDLVEGVPRYIFDRLSKVAQKSITQSEGLLFHKLNVHKKTCYLYSGNLAVVATYHTDRNQAEADEFIEKVNSYYSKLLKKYDEKTGIPLIVYDRLLDKAKTYLHRFDGYSSRKEYINKLTYVEKRNLCLRDQYGDAVKQGGSSVTFSFDNIEKAPEMLNAFIEKVNKHYESLPKLETFDLKDKVNGVPKYVYDKLSNFAKLQIVKNHANPKNLLNLIEVGTRFTLWLYDSKGNSSLGISDDSAKEDVDKFVRDVNSFYFSLEKECIEKDRDTGIPCYVLNMLSDEAKKNLYKYNSSISDIAPEYANKLTHNEPTLCLRDEKSQVKEVFKFQSPSSWKLGEKNLFIERVNSYYETLKKKELEKTEEKSTSSDLVYKENERKKDGLPAYVSDRLSYTARLNIVKDIARPKNQLNVLENNCWFYDRTGKVISMLNTTSTKEDADKFCKTVNDYFVDIGKTFTETDPATKIPLYVYNNLSDKAKKQLYKFDRNKSRLSPDYKNKLTYSDDSLCFRDKESDISKEVIYDSFDFIYSKMDKIDKFLETVNSFYETFEEKKPDTAESRIPEHFRNLFSATTKKYLIKIDRGDESDLKTFALKATVSDKSLCVRDFYGVEILSIDFSAPLGKQPEVVNKYFAAVDTIINGLTPRAKQILEDKTLFLDVRFYGEGILQCYIKNHKGIVIKQLTNLFDLATQKYVINALNYFANHQTLRTEKFYLDDGQTKLKTISSEDILDYIPLLDYYKNKGIENLDFDLYSYSLNSIKPSIVGGMLEYNINGDACSQKQWYESQIETVSVETYSGETIEVPWFIQQIIKNRKVVPYPRLSESNINLKTEIEWMLKQTESFVIYNPNQRGEGGRSLMEVEPEEFKKVYKKYFEGKEDWSTFPKFWRDPEIYSDRESPKITHIVFDQDDAVMKITEKDICVDGQSKSLREAIDIKSKSIKDEAEFMEEIYKNLDENGIPVYLKTRFEDKPEYLASLSSYKNYIESKYGTSIEKGNLSRETFNGFIANHIKAADAELLLSKLEEVNKLLLSKKETKEAKENKVETSVLVKHKIFETAVSDGKEVAKRLVVMNVSNIIQNLLIQLITSSVSKQKKQMIGSKLEEFFSSEKGKAILQISASAALPYVSNHIPEKYREQVSIIADEFRIQGETTIVLELTNKLTEVLKNKVVEDLINSGELVRVDLTPATNQTPNQFFGKEEESDLGVSSSTSDKSYLVN